MAFKKSALAVAVTVALSSHAFAGSIEIESTDKNATYSLSDSNIPVYDGTVGFEDFTKKTIGYDRSFGNGDAEVLGYANKSLSISGTIDMIDVELKRGETLGSGAAADNPHGLEFKNAKSERTYIETNGASIQTNGSGNAINITNSTLDVFATDENGNKVEPILIYNNGGKITALNNDAIAITGSTVNGNILNGSTARTNDLGQAQPATSGTIKGERTGIRIEKTTFTGSIINEKDSLIDGTYGISVDSSSRYKGDIDNIGTINGSMKGINLSDNAQFNGEINNTGIIAGGNSSDRDYGIFIDDNVTGKVVINQRDGELSGYTALRMNKETTTNLTGGSILGNVENYGGKFNQDGGLISGDILNQDAKFFLNSGDITGNIINKDGKFEQSGGTITGNITNSNDHKFELSGGNILGDITNSDSKFNLKNGDIIGDIVNNNGKLEQSGGSIVGNVTNNKGKFEYKGGSIKGNVNNDGGTFYVKGNQTIVGDYMQTAGSTLAMGLYTETSLTADNINLDAGSKVLIDLNAGNIYVQDGAEIELLKGNITDTDVSYEVNSSLVKIAEVKRNSEGNLVLVFDRTSYSAAFEDAINRYPNKINANKINHYRKMQATIDRLSEIQNNSSAASELLTLIQRKFGDDVIAASAQLAPEISRATSSAAMGATRLSNDQIVGRTGGLASGDILDNSGMWIQALVSNGEQDNRNGEAYDVKSHGFVLGADTKLDDGLVLGAAYSFINSESTTQNSKIDSDYHMATIYGAQTMGQVLLDGQAYYAWGDNDSSRSIGTTASYDSSLYGARVGAGYQLDVAPATRLVPSLSLEASRLSVDGYTESGVGALKVDKQNFNRLELGLSTKLSKDYQLSRSTLTPSANVGAFHDFEAEAQSVTASFNIPGALTQSYAGEAPEKTRYVAGVGLDIVSEGNLTVSAEYNYNWNTDGFDANAGALKFRWDF